jgi:hypothetical protein
MRYEESNLQKQCVSWFRAQYPQYAMLLIHPINEGSGHSRIDRMRQGIHKAEGAVAGVSDLLLLMPATIDNIIYHGIGFELKEPKKGKQSQVQKDFEMMFKAAGYEYEIIRYLEEFQMLANTWISHVEADRRRMIAATHVDITKAAENREKEKFYKIIGRSNGT